MRRLQILLLAAGLLAAPTRAVAGPALSPHAPTTGSWSWSWSSERPRLGAMVLALTPELRTHFGAPADRGVLVARVMPASPAAAAGLAVGDLITAVDGAAIDDGADVVTALAAVKAGTAVTMAVVRDHRPLTLAATLRAPAAAGPGPWREGAPSWPDWLRELFRRFPPAWQPTPDDRA